MGFQCIRSEKYHSMYSHNELLYCVIQVYSVWFERLLRSHGQSFGNTITQLYAIETLSKRKQHFSIFACLADEFERMLRKFFYSMFRDSHKTDSIQINSLFIWYNKWLHIKILLFFQSMPEILNCIDTCLHYFYFIFFLKLWHNYCQY